MVWAGSSYFVIFHGYVNSFDYGIEYVRTHATLTPLDTVPGVITSTPWANDDFYLMPGAAASDDGFFIAWEYQHATGTSELYGARVDTSGQSLDGDGFPITTGLPHTFAATPLVTWNGAQWVVGWPESGEYRLASLGGPGSISPSHVPVPGAAQPVLAGSDGATRHTWVDARSGGPRPLDIYTALLDADVMPGPEHPVSLSVPYQTDAAVAAGAENYLVAYLSSTAAGARIMANVLDDAGAPLLAEPVQLVAGAVADPRVGFASGRYLVVWADASGATPAIVGARLAADGTLLDTTPLAIMNGHDPDVADLPLPAEEGRFLVTGLQGTGPAAHVQGMRVGGDGSLLDPAPLAVSSDHSLAPRVIRSGQNWFAAWEATGRSDGSEIDGAAVTATGLVVPYPLTADGDGHAHHRPVLAGADERCSCPGRIRAAAATSTDGACWVGSPRSIRQTASRCWPRPGRRIRRQRPGTDRRSCSRRAMIAVPAPIRARTSSAGGCRRSTTRPGPPACRCSTRRRARPTRR